MDRISPADFISIPDFVVCIADAIEVSKPRCMLIHRVTCTVCAANTVSRGDTVQHRACFTSEAVHALTFAFGMVAKASIRADGQTVSRIKGCRMIRPCWAAWAQPQGAVGT